MKIPTWIKDNHLENRLIAVEFQGRDQNGKKVVKFPNGHRVSSVVNTNTIALKTGNGLVVVDIDTKVNIDEVVKKWIRCTLTIETTNGYHLYFKDTHNIKNRVKMNSVKCDVDIRAEGGVIFAETTDRDSYYKYIDGTFLVDLPRELYDLLQESETKKPTPTPLPTATATLDDQEIIQKMQNANQWELGVGQNGNSEIDMKFFNSLIFWTGGDISQMDRIARSNSLYRTKWDKKINGTTHLLWQLDRAIKTYNGNFYEAGYGRETISTPTTSLTTGETKMTPPKALINILQLGNVKKEPTEFICKDFIPMPKKAITLLTATGGTGKSFVALQVALRCVKDGLKVLGWFSEDESGLTKHRAEMIKKISGLNDVNINALDITDTMSMPFTKLSSGNMVESEDLQEILKIFMPYDLIILDPLIAFFGGDENSNVHARKFMDILTQWLRDNNKSILFVHHSAKGTNNSRGASAFQDASRLSIGISMVMIEEEEPTIKKDIRRSVDINRKHMRAFDFKKDNYNSKAEWGTEIYERQIFPSELSLRRISASSDQEDF